MLGSAAYIVDISKCGCSRFSGFLYRIKFRPSWAMIAHLQCEPSSRLRILFSSFCLLPPGLGLNILSWARPAPSHIPLLFRFVVSAQAV
jgi:hypothetical protein